MTDKTDKSPLPAPRLQLRWAVNPDAESRYCWLCHYETVTQSLGRRKAMMTPREAWEERKRLRTEAYRLEAYGRSMIDKGNSLIDEAYNLSTEGSKIFIEAVTAQHSSLEIIKWLPDGGCEVNGEVFES